MKRILFVLAMFVCSMAAHAGLDVNVASGSLKPLKMGGNAIVVFNFSEAKWDNKQELKYHYSNLNELAAQCPYEFGRKFRDTSKYVQLVNEESQAKWKMEVKVFNMDSYYNVMGFGLPGHVTKVEGLISITDIASGEPIATIEIDEVDGGRNVTIEGSFRDCFEELGDQVAKLLNKGK